MTDDQRQTAWFFLSHNVQNRLPPFVVIPETLRLNEKACAVDSSIHWRRHWAKQSTPFTSLEEIGGGAWRLALAQAAYHGQRVPWWCQHHISIKRGGRERQGGGGGLHHSAMARGEEQDVRCCQNTTGVLNRDKKLFLMFDSRKCWYKKGSVTKLKPDESFMGL